MSYSFWTGGPGAYARGLREHYERQLSGLRSDCEQAGDGDRDRLGTEIARTEPEYESKLNSIDESLY